MDLLSKAKLPKRTYVDAFRLVVWQYINYQVLLGDISPEYDECPRFCFRKEQSDGFNFCDGCEIKIAKGTFEELAKEELKEKLGSTWERYGFEKLLTDIINIVNSEDDDRKKWPVKTEILFGIYVSQRNRLQRIDNWNFKQKNKNKE